MSVLNKNLLNRGMKMQYYNELSTLSYDTGNVYIVYAEMQSGKTTAAIDTIYTNAYKNKESSVVFLYDLTSVGYDFLNKLNEIRKKYESEYGKKVRVFTSIGNTKNWHEDVIKHVKKCPNEPFILFTLTNMPQIRKIKNILDEMDIRDMKTLLVVDEQDRLDLFECGMKKDNIISNHVDLILGQYKSIIKPMFISATHWYIGNLPESVFKSRGYTVNRLNLKPGEGYKRATCNYLDKKVEKALRTASKNGKATKSKYFDDIADFLRKKRAKGYCILLDFAPQCNKHQAVLVEEMIKRGLNIELYNQLFQNSDFDPEVILVGGRLFERSVTFPGYNLLVTLTGDTTDLVSFMQKVGRIYGYDKTIDPLILTDEGGVGYFKEANELFKEANNITKEDIEKGKTIYVKHTKNLRKLSSLDRNKQRTKIKRSGSIPEVQHMQPIETKDYIYYPILADEELKKLLPKHGVEWRNNKVGNLYPAEIIFDYFKKIMPNEARNYLKMHGNRYKGIQHKDELHKFWIGQRVEKMRVGQNYNMKDYYYIGIKKTITNYKEGDEIILDNGSLATILGKEETAISHEFSNEKLRFDPKSKKVNAAYSEHLQ